MKAEQKHGFELKHHEVLKDGRSKFTYDNGAVAYSAPLPADKKWEERVICEISEISYRILRREAEE